LKPLNFDLHTHSNRSDGALAPADLVVRAQQCGIDVLALTDHDTVDGLSEADRAAARAGIRLVPGVEVSASWRSQAIHILGLWIDPDSAALRAHLDAQGIRRHARMARICARLDRQDLPGTALLADVQAQPGIPTRAHLAIAMVARGLVRTPQDAFRKYLGKGRPAGLAAEWPPLGEVVGWITAAGGVASLAHPARYGLSAGARRRLIQDFLTAGGTSLEVVSGANGMQHVDACAQLAGNFGLTGSVGSDFHDPKLTWNPLGRSLKLPDCVTPVWRGFGL
jgi:predicted metal-dependent phosphoesterase TrpH